MGPLRVLTWNLFHGRAVPPVGRDLEAEFAAALAGWAWDVALLQEVPPWWPAGLAARAGASERHVLTSRNALAPLRRALARRWPDAVGSQGGGANAILVRGEVRAHRALRLRLLPERRVVHAVALPDGVWVGNLHGSAHRPARAAADLERAGALRTWAGPRAPVVLGGDLNLRRPAVAGHAVVASRDVDHVLVGGLEPAADPEVLDCGTLSDHPPLRATLRFRED